MDKAPVTYLFAGIPTRDFESALGWYERLLGRSPDQFPHDAEAVWQLADTGLIYLVADSRRAGNAMITLIVDDLDRWIEETAGREMSPARAETVPGNARKATFVDPDGNEFTVGELVSARDP